MTAPLSKADALTLLEHEHFAGTTTCFLCGIRAYVADSIDPRDVERLLRVWAHTGYANREEVLVRRADVLALRAAPETRERSDG